ncbi:MAG: serine hydrolase [Flavobacteriales bacterium]|nr:serine hydrolase [Flavobacteriales bacterium]
MKHTICMMKKAGLLTFLTLVTLFSCSKNPDISPDGGDKPSNVASAAKSLTYFAFFSANNTSLKKDCPSVQIGNTFYVTVPMGVSLKDLKATYSISAKATASVKGVGFANNTTAQDYTDAVEVTVTAENKTAARYYILAKNGITELDNKVYDFMKKYTIPGISVSVAYNEKLVYAEGFGYANTDTHERLTADYMLRLASCSKPFTSLCIMELLKDGKLKLDDRPFAKGGVLYDKYPEHNVDFEAITIQSLLEHTSGINQTFDPMFDNDITKNLSSDETIKYVVQNFNTRYSVGEVHSYSNFGFCVLGRVVEAVSGKTYEEFLKEAVLSPAGVKTAIRVGSTGKANRYSKETVYYSQSGTNGYGNNMKRLDSCGGLIASTPALMRMACALDGKDGMADILPQNIIKIMETPAAAKYNYALGWRVNHSFFPQSAYHSGNLAGTATMWVRNSNATTHCAVLCNSRSYISGFDDALYVLIRDVIAVGGWSAYPDVFSKYEE